MRIYVSSTYVDLQIHREKVRGALRKMGHEDVAMEYYPAGNEHPVEKCLTDVVSCDLYIGIFAYRYGYIPNRYMQSITELEYRKAVDTGIKTLIFLLAEDADWSVSKIEIGALDRIKQLREELSQKHIVDFFLSEDDLVAKVSQAVSALEQKNGLHVNREQNIEVFVHQYLEQLVHRHRYINPPSFHSAKQYAPIDSLFVEPTLSGVRNTSPAGDFIGNISLQQFISQINRTVLLANPGGGKTTIAKKICIKLGHAKEEREQHPVPFLVILRDYGAEKKRTHCSILDFINRNINSDYQIEPPLGALDELLNKGRILVIFDGLDELLETNYRQNISQDIEAFCNKYPRTRVLVTSRRVGYEEAPLDNEAFSVYQIEDFSHDQLNEYVQKWFSLDLDHLSKNWELAADTFLEEIEMVPNDVRFNPLMLSLLCSIYQGEGYIPRNRFDLYAKCSELLIERRDKERTITYDLPFQHHVRPTIMYLAHWIHSSFGLESGVAENKLIAKAVEYLLIDRLEDRDEAESVARRFIEYCVGRAWVFTDVGLTRDGERLFQFTHRTFLEYFTAAYLNRIYRTPEALFTALKERISKREWDSVAQLAFQQMDRSMDDATNILINLLIENAGTAPISEAVNFLAFGGECLHFVIPKSSSVNHLVTASLDLGIKLAVNQIEEVGLEDFYLEHNFYDHEDFVRDTLLRLIKIKNENRETFVKSLEEFLVSRINADTSYTALVASEIALNLSSVFRLHHDEQKFMDERREMDMLSKQIIIQCREHMVEYLCPKYIRTCLDLYGWNEVSLTQMVQWHGTEILFNQFHYSVFANLYNGEIAPHLLSDLCREKSDLELRKHYIASIKEIGAILISKPPPYTYVERGDTWMLGSCGIELPIDSNTVFGIFTITAFLYERWYENVGMGHWSIEGDKILFPEYLNSIILCRVSETQVSDEDVQRELDKCGFDPHQRKFVEAWAYRRLNMLG